MTVEIKAIIALVSLLISISCVFYILDFLQKRETLRQFYRDLVRLVLLYEQYSLVWFVEAPKILGHRIVHFGNYEAIIKEIANAYEQDSIYYNSMFDYVLSLHRFYCFSNRDLIKFKNKLFKENAKNETQSNSRN